MVKVLFVCLGNICRSPTAEGVFRKLVQEQNLARQIEIDSAGTHAYHVGEPPDERAQDAALRRGVDISGLRGRKAIAADMRTFDYVLAMDNENFENLRAICPAGLESKIRLFLEFAPNRPEKEVPDPYFGGAGGFDRVLDMIEEAALGLLEDIRRQHL
jgi:protein-tyrosine phosphatase